MVKRGYDDYIVYKNEVLPVSFNKTEDAIKIGEIKYKRDKKFLSVDLDVLALCFNLELFEVRFSSHGAVVSRTETVEEGIKYDSFELRPFCRTDEFYIFLARHGDTLKIALLSIDNNKAYINFGCYSPYCIGVYEKTTNHPFYYFLDFGGLSYYILNANTLSICGLFSKVTSFPLNSRVAFRGLIPIVFQGSHALHDGGIYLCAGMGYSGYLLRSVHGDQKRQLLWIVDNKELIYVRAK